MKFIWFVVFLVSMPLFILIAGLGAAADRLAFPVLWLFLGAIVAAGVIAARLPTRGFSAQTSEDTRTTPSREPDEELCSAADVSAFVQAFYARLRSDAVLGPLFDSRISDRDEHLGRMTAYWSSVLRGT